MKPNPSPAVKETDPEAIYRLTAGLDGPGADGFFISCTNLRSMEVIERLEKDLSTKIRLDKLFFPSLSVNFQTICNSFQNQMTNYSRLS